MKQQINAANAPAAIGPYCHAIEMEGFIFTSGQLGIAPAPAGFYQPEERA